MDYNVLSSEQSNVLRFRIKWRRHIEDVQGIFCSMCFLFHLLADTWTFLALGDISPFNEATLRPALDTDNIKYIKTKWFIVNKLTTETE